MGTDHPTHRPVSRLARAVMSLFAAPRVNMREDYEKVRRLQRQMAALPAMRYHDLDREVRSADGGHCIPVRVFEPSTVRRDEVLLFFHGGGWVTGDIDSYTPACLTMAELTGAVVASVDYRLAPEYPFPAGLEDCHRIARLLLDEPGIAGVADPSRIVMIGDSAGANLAAVTNLMLREEYSAMPGRQILLYPVTHWDHDPQTSPFSSVREHGADYRLTNTEVQDYLELYAPDPAQRRSPRVSPLMATDLSGQPDTLVLSAELDLLCDEGEAYGRRLQEAGNRVTIHRVPGALHGFITLPRFARPLREAYEQINAFLDEDAGGERP